MDLIPLGLSIGGALILLWGTLRKPGSERMVDLGHTRQPLLSVVLIVTGPIVMLIAAGISFLISGA